jgi:two-component system nitrogen regulation sensor histidine kinase NtrY
MVDEFSSFARMPTPVMKNADLGELVEQAVFLQRTAHPDISFVWDRHSHPVVVSCDRQQIARALTNLLQNAIDAIQTRRVADNNPPPEGRISVTLSDEETTRAIIIEDNGPGLPLAERDRLTEPYVTTRKKGTGLGLAIVKKIMEDHEGDLRLADGPLGGACATLVFNLPDDDASPVSVTASHANQKGSAHGV